VHPACHHFATTPGRTGEIQVEIRTPVSGSADNFNWPVAVLAPPAPELEPFARFGARVQIVLGPGAHDDRLAVEALFTLGAGSNGIDPLTEPVTLALGTEEWTIPPGSFRQTRLGGFVFKGRIGATNLGVTIQPFRGGTIGFAALGAGAELTGTENPVDVRLIIGDDGSTTVVVASCGVLAPRPSTKRPSEIACIVAAAIAMVAALRFQMPRIPVPSVIRVVRAAASASSTVMS
jgi:hypothetical protein